MFVCPHFTHIWHFFVISLNFVPPRPDPTRPSRFWDAYYYKTINFTEKNFKTKNVCLHHKTYVLKFGNVSSHGVWGRPSFVRVTLFPFFGYNFWSNKKFWFPTTAFERTRKNLSESYNFYPKIFIYIPENSKFREKIAFFIVLFSIKWKKKLGN